jgi:hypothetical protein
VYSEWKGKLSGRKEDGQGEEQREGLSQALKRKRGGAPAVGVGAYGGCGDSTRKEQREVIVREGEMRDVLLIREYPSVPCILPSFILNIIA